MSATAEPALTFTGERFAPEVKGAIWHEHWHRYCLARPLAQGLRVLDAACGEGYGSFLLAQTAAQVYGIDIESAAVAHARARYRAPNLSYLEGSVTALPLPDAAVDLVVSFETIEHLAEQAAMLAEFRRVLAPGGVLLISSPNQPVYSGDGGGVNEFHVRELTRFELAALLDPVFPQQSWYGQRVAAYSALWSEHAAADGARAGTLVALEGDAVRAPAAPPAPMYFVVVCAAPGVALPPLPPLSLFDDGGQSLYDDYVRALIAEKTLYWDGRNSHKIAEDRLAELIVAVNGLASERERSAALAARIDALEATLAVVTAERDAAHAAAGAAEAAAREAAARARDAVAATRAELDAVCAAELRLVAKLAAIGDERDAARIDLATANDVLVRVRAELGGTLNELAVARDRRDEARLELIHAGAELAGARATIAGQVAMLDEVRARLAFRETAVGWLRWPLSRLKRGFGAQG